MGPNKRIYEEILIFLLYIEISRLHLEYRQDSWTQNSLVRNLFLMLYFDRYDLINSNYLV